MKLPCIFGAVPVCPHNRLPKPDDRKGLGPLILWLVFWLSILQAPADPLDHWTTRPSGVASSIASVTYVSDQFVAVGAIGSTFNSHDGIGWSHLYNSASGSFLYGVTYTNSIFVAVGDNGAVQTSKDGTNWIVRLSQTGNYLSG